MGRVVGVDLGSKRVGFALSDPDRIIASAFRMVECRHDRELEAAILAVLAETGADLCVIGHPINMNGTRGPAAERAEKIRAALQLRTPVPLVLWDERLTTKSAHDVLIEAGTPREKRKRVVDKNAAQIMLQHYFDAHGS